MRMNLVRAAALSLCAVGTFAQSAAAPVKLGIINIQGAIIGTKDGKRASQELETKFGPKKKEMDTRNNEIVSLEEQLRKGGSLMTDDKRNQMQRDIDDKKRRFQRDAQDAQEELNQAQQRLIQGVGQRVYAVIEKYAKDNGYTMILDVSAQNTPVLYAATSSDITSEIVTLYDKSAPNGAAPAAAVPPASVKR